MSCETKRPKDSDLFVGKSLTKTKTFSYENVIEFGKLSLDFNPLHIVEQEARETRFKGCIIHGKLTESLFSGVLAELTPWCVYTHDEVDFRLPVRVGDTITATGTITEIVFKENRPDIIKVALFAVNQNHDVVLRGKTEMKKLKEMYRADSPPNHPVLHSKPI